MYVYNVVAESPIVTVLVTLLPSYSVNSDPQNSPYATGKNWLSKSVFPEVGATKIPVWESVVDVAVFGLNVSTKTVTSVLAVQSLQSWQELNPNNAMIGINIFLIILISLN